MSKGERANPLPTVMCEAYSSDFFLRVVRRREVGELVLRAPRVVDLAAARVVERVPLFARAPVLFAREAALPAREVVLLAVEPPLARDVEPLFAREVVPREVVLRERVVADAFVPPEDRVPDDFAPDALADDERVLAALVPEDLAPDDLPVDDFAPEDRAEDDLLLADFVPEDLVLEDLAAPRALVREADLPAPEDLRAVVRPPAEPVDRDEVERDDVERVAVLPPLDRVLRDFASSDLAVAARPLVLAAARFVPAPERDEEDFDEVDRDEPDFEEADLAADPRAEVLRAPEALFAVVRREAEPLLARLPPSPEALLRAVEVRRAADFFSPDADALVRAEVERREFDFVSPPSLFREEAARRVVVFSPSSVLREEAARRVVFFSVAPLLLAAVRLREPEALRRAVPLRVDPLLAVDLRPPPRARMNLKKRLVPPDATSSWCRNCSLFSSKTWKNSSHEVSSNFSSSSPKSKRRIPPRPLPVRTTEGRPPRSSAQRRISS